MGLHLLAYCFHILQSGAEDTSIHRVPQKSWTFGPSDFGCQKLTMMTQRIEDENGRPWHVGAGDPANEYVLYLKARGYHYIVMPSSMLTGDASGGIIPVAHVGHLVPIHLPPPGADPARVTRRARLIDCMEVLRVRPS